MAGLKKFLKSITVFNEPKKRDEFILKENEKNYSGDIKELENDASKIKEKKFIRKLVKEKAEKEEKNKNGSKENNDEKPDISRNIKENLEFIKKRLDIPQNGDAVLREFDIVIKDKLIPAFIIYFDGLTDRMVINTHILQPLMLLSNLEIKGRENDISEFVKSHILPHNQLTEVRTHQKVVDEINFGGCGIYIEGTEVAFVADAKGWEHRGIERPNTELVIRGPQEGFNESIRANTALIRKRLKDDKLIVENTMIGKRSKTPCSMLYIKDIANESLVNEVRRRIEGIKADHILDSGELEQYIEDDSYLPVPQMSATERPDRVCSMLAEGRVAIVVNGSPFVLVMPITNHDLFHAAEDMYVRVPYSNLLRFVRYLAITMSLLLPGLYIAITNFHQEMIPTDLLLAITASRESVPFPSVVEIIIMEISFELIREAGIRIPGPIGPTLGIIGALILGQAAVAANIVSPILIIVVAVTGIGSFAIPSFSMGFAFRLLRFGFIFFAALSGFLGISTGLFMLGLWLANSKSFGVPLFTPFGPKTMDSIFGRIAKKPVWKQEKRLDYLNVKKRTSQPEISRTWTGQKSKGESNGEDENNEES